MAFDEALADRIRPLFRGKSGFEEKRMFGGVGCLLRGNMCCAIWKEFLILRLGPDAGAAALREPHTRPFDITGRPMAGWVMVEPEGIETAESLRRWIDLAVDFAATLPPKPAAAKIGSAKIGKPKAGSRKSPARRRR